VGRPPDPEKRLLLARAAVAVLEQQGVDLSMAALADALGVKRPTLHYHFPSKTDIVSLALVDLLTQQATVVLAQVDQHRHPIDRLYAHLLAVHRFHHGREQRIVFLTQAILATAGAQLPIVLAAGAQVFEVHRRDVVRRLREGIEEGTVALCDPDALFATVRALVDGLLVQRVVDGADIDGAHRLVWERLLLPLRLAPSPHQ
jgi:TetR/AcrR family transcriptional regulator, transcriptional repressor for nem operon